MECKCIPVCEWDDEMFRLSEAFHNTGIVPETDKKFLVVQESANVLKPLLFFLREEYKSVFDEIREKERLAMENPPEDEDDGDIEGY